MLKKILTLTGLTLSLSLPLSVHAAQIFINVMLDINQNQIRTLQDGQGNVGNNWSVSTYISEAIINVGDTVFINATFSNGDRLELSDLGGGYKSGQGREPFSFTLLKSGAPGGNAEGGELGFLEVEGEMSSNPIPLLGAGFGGNIILPSGSGGNLTDSKFSFSGVEINDRQLTSLREGTQQAANKVYFSIEAEKISILSPVPVPAAAWLFGSALIGLAGIKRKK